MWLILKEDELLKCNGGDTVKMTRVWDWFISWLSRR